jgi:hypothetical protein
MPRASQAVAEVIRGPQLTRTLLMAAAKAVGSWSAAARRPRVRSRSARCIGGLCPGGLGPRAGPGHLPRPCIRSSGATALNETGALHQVTGDLVQARRCHQQTLDLAALSPAPGMSLPADRSREAPSCWPKDRGLHRLANPLVGPQHLAEHANPGRDWVADLSRWIR